MNEKKHMEEEELRLRLFLRAHRVYRAKRTLRRWSEMPELPPSPKSEPASEFKPDTVVQAVLDKFVARARFGKEKYGQTLDRDDLSVLDWIQHAQEEHMDAILYLEKLKRVIGKEGS